MTLHAVPNQHLHLFPIFYTLWSPPTIQNTLLKLPLLNLYWNDSILQVYPTSCKQLSASLTHFKYHGTLFWNYSNLNYAEKAQSCKYIQILADPFSVLPKPFMWVDLLFGNYLIMLKAPPPSTTSLKESSVKKKKKKKKNQFSKLIPILHSKTVCVNKSRGGICREGKIPDLSQADTSQYQVHKIQPITKHHVLLLGHARTNHTSARVSNDISTSTRVSNDTSSPARVSDDTDDLARVSDDIGRPIRLWHMSPIELRHLSLTHLQTPINRSLPKAFERDEGSRSTKALQESSLKAFKNFNPEIEEHSKQNHSNYLPRS